MKPSACDSGDSCRRKSSLHRRSPKEPRYLVQGRRYELGSSSFPSHRMSFDRRMYVATRCFPQCSPIQGSQQLEPSTFHGSPVERNRLACSEDTPFSLRFKRSCHLWRDRRDRVNAQAAVCRAHPPALTGFALVRVERPLAAFRIQLLGASERIKLFRPFSGHSDQDFRPNGDGGGYPDFVCRLERGLGWNDGRTKGASMSRWYLWPGRLSGCR